MKVHNRNDNNVICPIKDPSINPKVLQFKVRFCGDIQGWTTYPKRQEWEISLQNKAVFQLSNLLLKWNGNEIETWSLFSVNDKDF